MQRNSRAAIVFTQPTAWLSWDDRVGSIVQKCNAVCNSKRKRKALGQPSCNRLMIYHGQSSPGIGNPFTAIVHIVGWVVTIQRGVRPARPIHCLKRAKRRMVITHPTICTIAVEAVSLSAFWRNRNWQFCAGRVGSIFLYAFHTVRQAVFGFRQGNWESETKTWSTSPPLFCLH